MGDVPPKHVRYELIAAPHSDTMVSEAEEALLVGSSISWTAWGRAAPPLRRMLRGRSMCRDDIDNNGTPRRRRP